MFCSKRGSKSPPGARFCHDCGASVFASETSPARPTVTSQTMSSPSPYPIRRLTQSFVALGVLVTVYTLFSQQPFSFVVSLPEGVAPSVIYLPCCRRWSNSISSSLFRMVSASCWWMPISATVRAAPSRTFALIFASSNSSSVSIAHPVSACAR